jgi:translation initiation factor IF-3
VKGIRLTFGISDHDLEVRARLAEKFLKEGDVVRIEMRLRGREKALSNFAREKMKKFVEMLQKLIPIKIEKEVRKEARGLTMIILKQ